MTGRTQGLPIGQGGETRQGTPPCLGPCPLRLLGPQPPHPWSTWTFSRRDVSLKPLLQSGFSPQPLLFLPYRRRQPGPCPSESLYSGVSLLWVHCWVQPTAPRWSQGDMQLPVHTGPQESTPTSTVDRPGLRGSGEGQAERPPRTAAPTCPNQHCPAATLRTRRRGRPAERTATVACAWPPRLPSPEGRAGHTRWVHPTPAALGP